ncbi:hypothetical protein BELL_1846g00020 [Botrytis elliptica]|uniref:Uncharacterized protein n=1 Tax=Botrytis elliptica TaxID=278938 RepID=A0A4Z1HMH0_9HELO|nr:hypothetical protein BELL_1846g00020 [Botrytis elliptica]
MFWTADPESINQILSQGARFVKPVELFGFFDIYGPNMQTAMNDDWRFNREMVAPAIGSHANIKMWQASPFEMKKFTDLLSFFDIELTFEYFKEGSTGSEQVERAGFVAAMLTTIDKMGIIDNIPSKIRGKSS